MTEKRRNVLIIGIGGVTCGGKTTLATQLRNILPNTRVFPQDDYFLNVDDPRHTWIPELNHINYDILSSLDMEKMHQDILSFIDENNLKLVSDTEIKTPNINAVKDLKNDVYTRVKEAELSIAIIEGFSVFNYAPMLNLFNLKYYFLLSKEECRKRRETRVYDPPDCPGYFDKCAWPEHIAQLKEVQKNLKDVTYFNEDSRNVVEKILADVLKYV